MTVLSTLNSVTRSRSRSKMNMETDSDDITMTSSPNDLKECTSSFSLTSDTNSMILSPSKHSTSSNSSYLDIVEGRNEGNDVKMNNDRDNDDIIDIKRNTNGNEHREFHFAIENDSNLEIMVNNEYLYLNPLDVSYNNDYVLSKLYNYMKISEMSSYGISVFEMTFSSYLSYLNECDIIKLCASYWCNGSHFKCMISHRGDVMMNKCILSLVITDDLLDNAMQSGASVDKIEAMLKQKRMDDGIKKNGSRFYQTKYERTFYLRNLQLRLWNHEVLVRTFIKNGWLTPNLANDAMKSFIKNVYYRILNSPKYLKQNGCSQHFLHSFFVSHFCLDNIPQMYRMNNNNDDDDYMVNEEVLRRWCELVELLASRGANINESIFKQITPLQYAFNLGKNTHKIVSLKYKNKNKMLIKLNIPNDIWDITVSYL